MVAPSTLAFTVTSTVGLPVISSPRRAITAHTVSSIPLVFYRFRVAILVTTSATVFVPHLVAVKLTPTTAFFVPSLVVTYTGAITIMIPSPTTSLILVRASLADYTPVFSGKSRDSVSFTVMAPSLMVDNTPCLLSGAAFLPLNPDMALATSTDLSAPF